jgi:c(7)-type cytochrome triheme protein
MRLLACALVLALGAAIAAPAGAEYADVVLDRNSSRQGMRPVVFPHWFHRIRFRCKVCHSELGFKMRAGANNIQMDDIINGKFCGMCHNGQIAWTPERCDLCHSAKKGVKPGIYGSSETTGPSRW